MSDAETNIVKEFRTFYKYVCNLGRCINQVHDRPEKIENSLNELRANQRTWVEDNTADIRTIRANMVTKEELPSLSKR